MKVAVIGGGSSYTPELINGFLQRVNSLPITELWLMDIAPERLEVVAQRMVQAKSAPFQVHLTTDLPNANTAPRIPDCNRGRSRPAYWEEYGCQRP